MKYFISTALLLAICLTGTVVRSQENQLDRAALNACIDARDSVCEFVLWQEHFENTDALLLGGNGTFITVGAARMIFALEKSIDIMESETGLQMVDSTIDLVERKHDGTPFFFTSLNIFRAELCLQNGNAICAAESADYLCENADKLAVPQFPAKQQDEIMTRLLTVLENCGVN